MQCGRCSNGWGDERSSDVGAAIDRRTFVGDVQCRTLAQSIACDQTNTTNIRCT